MIDRSLRLSAVLFTLASTFLACSSSSDEQGNQPAAGTGGSAGASAGSAGDAGSDAGGAAGQLAGGSAGAGVGGDAGMGAGGSADGECPAGGIFGACTENPGCQCLRGATVYQFCTTNCDSAAECGTEADYPGAKPGCYPINPGDPNKICALICEEDEDCPCGLVCTASGLANTKLGAEMQ
jgi:hypothetical protein